MFADFGHVFEFILFLQGDVNIGLVFGYAFLYCSAVFCLSEVKKKAP